MRFVSFYYERVDNARCITEEAVAARRPLHELPASAIPEEGQTFDTRPTVDRMTPSECASVADESVTHAGRSYPTLRLISRSIYAQNIQRALFDTGGALPNVDVLHVWCDMSVGDCVWAAQHVSELAKADAESEMEGRTRRKLEFVRMRDVNHFVRWVSTRLCQRWSVCTADRYRVLTGPLGRPGAGHESVTREARITVLQENGE